MSQGYNFNANSFVPGSTQVVKSPGTGPGSSPDSSNLKVATLNASRTKSSDGADTPTGKRNGSRRNSNNGNDTGHGLKTGNMNANQHRTSRNNGRGNNNNNNNSNDKGGANRKSKPNGGGGGSRKESRRGGNDLSLSDILQSENRNKRGEISISHLVDLSPGPEHRQSQSGRRRVPGAGSTYSSSYYSDSYYSHSNSYLDKVSYINMTCRFVLDPRLEYKFLLNDPDSHVPMERVLRVICQPATCPICLEAIPEAPRMLECGHLICYPCLFRYLDADKFEVNPSPPRPSAGAASTTGSSGRKNKECPLCFDRIRIEKVKPVTLADVGDDRFDAPKVDGEAILRLMFRPNDSLLSIPRDTVGAKKSDFYDLPLVSEKDISQCSRLVRGSVEYAISEFQREIAELKKSREENRLMYQDDGYWHTEAIKMIQEMIRIYSSESGLEINDKDGITGSAGTTAPTSSANSPISGPSQPSTAASAIHSGQSTPQIHQIGEWQIEGDVPMGSFDSDVKEEVEESISEPIIEESVKNQLSSLSLNEEPVKDIQLANAQSEKFYGRYNDESAFFFYQTGSLESSTKYFLAPLDIRILKKAFGSYSEFPAIIVVKVENILNGTSVNDQLKKRMKYLGHLPTQTPVAFLECDWRDVVPGEVLRSFSKELQLRKKRKQDKEKREDRDQKRIQKEQEEQFRRDLLQESNSPFSYPVGSLGSPPMNAYDDSADPVLAPVPTLPVSPILGSSDSNDGSSSPWGSKTSFAQAASISKAEQDGRIIDELLSEAEQRKGRGGRKKLVLMSNRH
ncbi:Mag2p [Sugiyamaella lignohabitans]|uniref:Mag2p n=1 Tax=Sugiyamaella lignohabitans TaxID=796027 RepID=A0A167CRR6_9ASCO|nr:Mag2p [Sugiyamaella lignohabitans]ANB12031.1 Mag2p [Sugiyamaella lignohabitans]